MSPSEAGITTMSTGRDSSSFSGLTISRFTGIVILVHRLAGLAPPFRPWPSASSAFATASSIVPTM